MKHRILEVRYALMLNAGNLKKIRNFKKIHSEVHTIINHNDVAGLLIGEDKVELTVKPDQQSAEVTIEWVKDILNQALL